MPANGDEFFEDANVVFRNFAGRAGDFNSEGDRNFCIVLTPERAEDLRAKGWNVKTLRARDEGDDPNPYIQVSVNFNKGRPPKVVLINSQGRVHLGADEVSMLDIADVAHWDLVINPYAWEIKRGDDVNRGIKAYLKQAFVTLNENAFELKYADLPDLNPTTSNSTVSEEVDAAVG